MLIVLPILAAGAFVLTILALWWSVRALLVLPKSPSMAHTPDAVAVQHRLLREHKQSLLRSLQDLRLDHELGKIEAGDFDALNQSLRAEAHDVLAAQATLIAPYRAQADTLIESALRTAMLTAPTDAKTDAAMLTAPTDAETSKAHTTSSEQNSDPDASPTPSTSPCPQCGGHNDADARFCKHCGAALAETAP